MSFRFTGLVLGAAAFCFAAPVAAEEEGELTPGDTQLAEPVTTAGSDAEAASRSGGNFQPRIRISAGRAIDLVGSERAARRVKILSTRPVSDDVVSDEAFDGTMPAGSPLRSSRVTSSFGNRRHPISGGWRLHAGVDMAASRGTPIYATGSGTVRYAGWRGGYGLLVVVDHGDGVETRYAHMSQLGTSVGRKVRQGDVLGRVGSTGRSTGNHLHYETRVNGVPVNPVH